MKYKHQIIVKKFRLRGRFKFDGELIFDFRYHGSYYRCASPYPQYGDSIKVYRLESNGWKLQYRSNYKKLSTATLIMAALDYIEVNEI